MSKSSAKLEYRKQVVRLYSMWRSHIVFMLQDEGRSGANERTVVLFCALLRTSYAVFSDNNSVFFCLFTFRDIP